MYTLEVRMAFSDTWLKANNGKERAALEDRGDREGLGVRVTPKGKITFQLRYRYQGAAKRLDSYPRLSAALLTFGTSFRCWRQSSAHRSANTVPRFCAP